jgi:regulation of enolase protein 1 (concanavalin A-like superfamily)
MVYHLTQKQLSERFHSQLTVGLVYEDMITVGIAVANLTALYSQFSPLTISNKKGSVKLRICSMKGEWSVESAFAGSFVKTLKFASYENAKSAFDEIMRKMK